MDYEKERKTILDYVRTCRTISKNKLKKRFDCCEEDANTMIDGMLEDGEIFPMPGCNYLVTDRIIQKDE